MHDAGVFANSSMNLLFRDGSIARCLKVIVDGKDPVPVSFIGDPAYPYCHTKLNHLKKVAQEQYFGFRLSASMVAKCVFGQIKARNLKIEDILGAILTCFILHNFCEINRGKIQYESESQPSIVICFTTISLCN